MENVKLCMLSLCRQTDGRTTVRQYAPDLSIQGHKNTFNSVVQKEKNCRRHIKYGSDNRIWF